MPLGEQFSCHSPVTVVSRFFLRGGGSPLEFRKSTRLKTAQCLQSSWRCSIVSSLFDSDTWTFRGVPTRKKAVLENYPRREEDVQEQSGALIIVRETATICGCKVRPSGGHRALFWRQRVKCKHARPPTKARKKVGTSSAEYEHESYRCSGVSNFHIWMAPNLLQGYVAVATAIHP